MIVKAKCMIVNDGWMLSIIRMMPRIDVGCRIVHDKDEWLR